MREVESGLVFVESSEGLNRQVGSQIRHGGENDGVRRGSGSSRGTRLRLEVDLGRDLRDGQRRGETEQVRELFDYREISIRGEIHRSRDATYREDPS